MVKANVLPGRQWLCQEIHKDGVGCGLAKDEGSQGDQEDSITDQRPPAEGQRMKRNGSVILFMTLQTYIYMEIRYHYYLSHF